MTLWTSLLSLLDAIFSPLFAWHYDKLEEPQEVRAKRRELIDTVPRGARILEVGAGTGATLTSGAYEGSAGRFAKLVLSEPDRSMRARLSSKLTGRASGVSAGELVVTDAALPNLPFPNASFNTVVMFFVASHVEGRQAALAEVARVLEPGGKLLFIDHGIDEHGHHGHGGGHSQRAEGGAEGVVATTGTAHVAPFWSEWFRFWTHRDGHDDLSLDLLLRDFQNEDKLEEVFSTRMPTQQQFFKEIVYGCFVRRSDGDS